MRRISSFGYLARLPSPLGSQASSSSGAFTISTKRKFNSIKLVSVKEPVIVMSKQKRRFGLLKRELELSNLQSVVHFDVDRGCFWKTQDDKTIYNVLSNLKANGCCVVTL